MTLGEFLCRAESALSPSPDARADGVWMAEECLRLPRGQMYDQMGRLLTAEERAELEKALSRRIAGEPVQYIFSRAPFMGFEFYVDPRVLIPRMATETLCEGAYLHIKKKRCRKVLDLCAGSGAIGLSLKKMCPWISLTLSDISPDACDVERINARGMTGVRVCTGDLFSPVAGEKFDVITCNPPYIASRVIPTLEREVLREPRLALDGGGDGLDFYRRLAAEYRDYLNPGGRLYLEIGYDQGTCVPALFPFSHLEKDLSGQNRVVWTEV